MRELEQDQKQVLQVVLKKPEMIPAFIDTYFFTDEYRTLLEKVYEQQSKNKDLSLDFLQEKVGIDLSKDYTEGDIEYCYSELEEWNRTQFNIEVLEKANKVDLDFNFIEKVSAKYNQSYGDKTEGELFITKPEDFSMIRNGINGKILKSINCGYSGLNTLLTKNDKDSGGWKSGSTYCFMGMTGTGKSIFLCNFARRTWETNQQVLYISTEMDEFDISERIYNGFAQQKNIDETGIWINKHINKWPKNGSLRIKKVHPHDTSCEDIQIMIDGMDIKPTVIFIDYADELIGDHTSKKVDNEYQELGIVYAGIKKLAEVNDVPIITATQTNRDAENKETGGTKEFIGFGNIADSFKKAHRLDSLFSIVQPASMKNIQENKGNFEILTVKNRHGQHGTIPFKVDYQTMRLDEGHWQSEEEKGIAEARKAITNRQEDIKNLKKDTNHMTATDEFEEKLAKPDFNRRKK